MSAPTVGQLPAVRCGDDRGGQPGGRYRHATGEQAAAAAGGSPSCRTELDRLREQRAWLEAERAALCWAAGHDELTGLPNRRMFHSPAPS